MATPTNLYQYYTGKGQNLPGLNNLGQQYQSYGLGNSTGYQGTAQQNTALLGKLMGSGGYSSSQAPAAAPAATGAGYAAGNSSGDPTLNAMIGQLNGYQNEYQSTAAQQAKDQNDASIAGSAANSQNVIKNAFTGATDYGNMQNAQASMNKIQNQLTSSQNSQAAIPMQAVANAQGTFMNNDQMNTRAATNNIPYAAQVAQLSANLAPAENAYSSSLDLVKGESNATISGAQLAQQGFNAGQQKQLDAIQSKIAQGQALTNNEYQSYSALTTAQTSAAAQVKAAGISAGGAVSAAQLAANASKANTASNNAAMLQSAALQAGFSNVQAYMDALQSGNRGSLSANYTQPSNAAAGSGSNSPSNALNQIFSSNYKIPVLNHP